MLQHIRKVHKVERIFHTRSCVSLASQLVRVALLRYSSPRPIPLPALPLDRFYSDCAFSSNVDPRTSLSRHGRELPFIPFLLAFRTYCDSFDPSLDSQEEALKQLALAARS